MNSSRAIMLLSGVDPTMEVTYLAYHWGPSLGRRWHRTEMLPQRAVSGRAEEEKMVDQRLPSLQSPS